MHYDTASRQWVLQTGDSAYWLDDDKRPVRVRIELVTPLRVYLKATSHDKPMAKGQVWYESRLSRRVCPRNVYVHNGKAHVSWETVRIDFE